MEKFLFIEYPKCSTCRHAKEFLTARGIAFDARHIVENRPSTEELIAWIALAGGNVKKFFNTSGLRYKALHLKEKLPTMSVPEQIALLASDGMLVKRPLLIGRNSVRVGFRQAEWENPQ